MILTYKIKHNRDFSEELKKAYKVAEFAINNKNMLSSKYVKDIGLPSAISNQILRKYGRNKNIKRINKVNLTVPNQGIKVDKDNKTIYISCIKLELIYHFNNDFEKVNQIELNKEYAFVSCNYIESKPIETADFIGVDLNTTGHCAVVGVPKTGKIFKLGKKADHIHRKYKYIRKQLQKQGKYKLVKKIKNRESRILKDLNHKISRKIVTIAKDNNCGIRLENLEGIRNNKKHKKTFNYSLNSWSFYQLYKMIEYKARLLGILLQLVLPEYTSQRCSRCGVIGTRLDKLFKCSNCGNVEHADANASFNIALAVSGVVQFIQDRDCIKGSTDTPKVATLASGIETIEPPLL